jgi:hypothetical protein
MNKLTAIILMIPLLVACNSLFAGHPPANNAELPQLTKQESYTSVRNKLIAYGWAPYHSNDAAGCDTFDERCKGRPEMEACSDVDQGPCAWLWEKDKRIIVVNTIAGSNDEIFVSTSPYYGH